VTNSSKNKTGNCIYLSKSRKELSYLKQEHIIPAALGGNAKLSKGIVSDEANELFSKYELKALRNSFLSINRNNLGPGKRGSLSVNNVTNPTIKLFEAVNNEQSSHIDAEYAPIRLGFLFIGEAYIISQIFFPINNDWSIKIPRFVMDSTSKDAVFSIQQFWVNLEKFIKNKDKKYTLIKSELKRQDKYVLIGAHNGKWVISTSLNNNQLEKFIQMLERKTLPENIPALASSSSTYRYSNILMEAFDESMPFIYIKTAFNILALFKGSEYMLESQFDEVRSAVINVKDTNKFFIEKPMPEWLISWVTSEVKTKEHFVVINAEDNYVEAYVSFYREPLWDVIRLSNNYSGEHFRKGFICNWEHSNERYPDIPL